MRAGDSAGEKVSGFQYAPATIFLLGTIAQEGGKGKCQSKKE
jgi:hypothetical protein